MAEFGCMPNVLSYNIILKGFCNEGRIEEALELLHMMADDGGGSCPPNVVSYNTVVNGLFRDGHVDRAYSLFSAMDDQGILPTVVTYSIVIDGLCKAQAVDRAEGVLQQMIYKRVKLNNRTYNCLHDKGKRGLECSKKCPHMVFSQMLSLVICCWAIIARMEDAQRLERFLIL